MLNNMAIGNIVCGGRPEAELILLVAGSFRGGPGKGGLLVPALGHYARSRGGEVGGWGVGVGRGAGSCTGFSVQTVSGADFPPFLGSSKTAF